MLPIIAGESQFAHMRRALWCIAQASQFGGDLDPHALAFATAPKAQLEPWQEAAIRSGELPEETNYAAARGLVSLGLNRVYPALVKALSNGETYRVAPLLADVVREIDSLASASAPPHWNGEERIRIQRFAGTPAATMRALRELWVRESAPSKAEGERLGALQAAYYKAQQLINAGSDTTASALRRLQATLGPHKPLHLQDAYAGVIEPA